jgi:hypothetical protein
VSGDHWTLKLEVPSLEVGPCHCYLEVPSWVGPYYYCCLEVPSLYCYYVLSQLVVALVLDNVFQNWTLGPQRRGGHWDQVAEVHLD